MSNATHTWTILGVTRFVPAPGDSPYISAIHWRLDSSLDSRHVSTSAFTTFGPEKPGAAELSLGELLALVTSPEVEAEQEAALTAAPGPEPDAPKPPVKRTRTRTAKGQFIPDDPSTLDNEAWTAQ